jgi:hypothetical protein
MTARILAALAVVLLLSTACGGNSVVRDSAAKKTVLCTPVATCTEAGPGSVIYFYDGGSSSTNGPIVSWEWDFGAGYEDATELEGLACHTFASKGNYQCTLRVTDGIGDVCERSVKVKIKPQYDAAPVSMVFGPFESDSVRQGGGGSLSYHHWRWRTLSYDPEDPAYIDEPVLEIAGPQLPPGDPDFDLLRVVYSAGGRDDFCGIEIGDGDATGDDLDWDRRDDDPTLKRTFVLPHVLEKDGSCISRSKEDVYVWKIKTRSGKGAQITEHRGHVTILK